MAYESSVKPDELLRHYGFTGSRLIPAPAQAAALWRWFSERRGWLHHGDCVGSDKAAHIAAKAACWRVTAHPGLSAARLCAFVSDADERRPPKPNLARNSDIVDETAELVATPDGPERLRSGTWSTIRKARALGRQVTIIWPDGRIDIEPARVNAEENA